MAKIVSNEPRHPKEQVYALQSSNVPYGLSLLRQISTLNIQQEANMTQGFIKYIRHNILYLYFSLAVTGLSSAQRFNVFNEQGQLICFVAESKIFILWYLSTFCV
jgi:hypothetical protein